MDMGTKANTSSWAEFRREEGVEVWAGPRMQGITETTPEIAEYWRRLETDRQVCIRECIDCGVLHHPRTFVCSECLGWNLRWKPIDGSGTIYSMSVVHQAPNRKLQSLAPYTLGLVVLHEGVGFFGKIEADSSDDSNKIEIGMKVRVGIDFVGENLLPIFRVTQ
jgi:uncharacterized OB-fold protein